MAFRRLLAVLFATAWVAQAAPLAAATADDIRRAAVIRERLSMLARERADIGRRLIEVQERQSSDPPDTARGLLDAERATLESRRSTNARESIALRGEFASLPPLVQQQASGPPGRLGTVDPQGLQTLGIAGSGDAGQVANPTAFNPAISVVPDFLFFRDRPGGGSLGLLEQADGFRGPHVGGRHGHATLVEGFNLRETEMAFSASVDPYFDTAAFFALSGDQIEAEEIYFQTRRLPAGLQVKGGRFLSGIGHVNRQHPHQWDFVDQNLAYALMLGSHGLAEQGMQVTWLPHTPFYVLVGGELLQGEAETLANYIGPAQFAGIDASDPPRVLGRRAGPRLFTGFMKVSPDIGYSSALQVGASVASGTRHQEVHDDDGDAVPERVLDGTTLLAGVDLVYRYDSPRQFGAGDVTVQSEYLHRRKDLAEVGTPLSVLSRNNGVYAQAVYGLAPRWQVAGRVATAGGTTEPVSVSLAAPSNTSVEYSTALTYNPTEFSRLRVQLDRGRTWVGGLREVYNQFYVQFQMSMGAHGAHRF